MPFPEKADHRLYVPWPGVVIDNADPEGLHRVRVEVKGFVEDTGWAFPLTMGGGSGQRGGHVVPAVGSDVVVQWLGGDPMRPIYQAAWWGKHFDNGNEMPQDALDAGADAHKVQSLQLGPIVITVDERDRADDGTGKRLTITDTNAGSTILEYDFELQGLKLYADYAIVLETLGVLNIKALQATFQDRPVRRGTVRPV